MRIVNPSAVLLTMLFAAEVSFACDCVTLSEKQSFEQAEIVFEGELIGITRVGVEIAYSFKVNRSLKGLNVANVVIVGGRNNCDAEFSPETIYRVYARKFEDKLISGVCFGNKVLRNKPVSTPAPLATTSWLDTNRDVLGIIGLTLALGLLIGFLPGNFKRLWRR